MSVWNVLTGKENLLGIRLPSAMRRAAATPTPREREWRRLPLRSRFRRVRPRVAAKLAPSARQPWRPVAASGVQAFLRISRDLVVRTVSAGYLGADLLERWAAIQAGQLPDNDDEIQPLRPGDIEEREAEQLADVEAWGRRREEAIRDEARQEYDAALFLAADLEDEASRLPPRRRARRAALLSQAASIREGAEENYAAAQYQLDVIADEVRERRAEIRAELRREVEQHEERIIERIADLQRGLDGEVEAAIQQKYFYGGTDCALEQWSLIT